MAKFRMMGGVFTDQNGQTYKMKPGRPGPVVESDIELDKKFRNSFQRVGEETQVAPPATLLRRTRASETQNDGRTGKVSGRDLGNDQPVGANPSPDYYDPELLEAAELDDEEKDILQNAKDMLKQHRQAKAERLKGENEEKVGLLKAEAKQVGEAPAKAQKGKAAKAQSAPADDEEDEEEEEEEEADDEDEEEAEDVTEEFADAGKFTVEKLDGAYHVKDAKGKAVSPAKGVTTKKDVTALLKKAAKK